MIPCLMDTRRSIVLLAAALTLPLAGQDGRSAVVHLADGTSVPLTAAALSYEYVAWKQGTPSYQAPPQRREAPELWLAKKSYPVKGQSLHVVFTPVEKEREVEGTVKRVKVPVASGVVIGDGTKKNPLKLEPPHRDLMLPDAERGLLLVVRTLDLRGETLTGTKKEFCLLSFTALVECPDDPGNQVVRIDFQ
jgi:hypothetical protein